MSKRDKTPDLMGDILSGKTQPEAKRPEPEEDPKIKATHYLRESTLFRLEQALTHLRMETGNRGLHRYDIVEQALRIVLDDLEQNGAESALTRRLGQM